MLKYEMNINRLANEMMPIDVIDIETLSSDNYPTGRMAIKCTYKSKLTINTYDTLTVRYADEILNSLGEVQTIVAYKDYIVSDVNIDDSIFLIRDDKRVRIECDSATIRKVYESGSDAAYGVDYIYFYFSQTHHFQPTDTEIIYTIYVNGISIDCQVVDAFTVRAVIDDNKEAYDFIFADEYNRMTKFISMNAFEITREQFFFDEYGISKVSFYLHKQISSIRIPLTSSFATDIHNEITIRTDFVDAERRKVIPAFNDIEKDIYHPVVCTSMNDEGDNVVFNNVDKIILNFHFRKHTGDKWTVDKTAVWNGVVTTDTVYNLMNNSASTNNGFFSYPTNKRDFQSDLLSYLGFTEADLKYRHNRLTKSFVRLSFYDSTDINKQSLLSYSVVYFDIGELFSKYMCNVSNEDLTYSRLENKQDGENTRTRLKGIRVDREPYWDNAQDRPENIDDIEKYRLSSQIVIKDKFNSSSTSEGFYLYLWKDNYTGIMPKDIYMKVEFNHAGYGRVIPFMMPYDDSGAKSFKKIIENDWLPSDDVDIPYQKGYNFDDYFRYSYIHFRYRYDRINNRHVYYLDPSYKLNNENTITLNLYEANVV